MTIRVSPQLYSVANGIVPATQIITQTRNPATTDINYPLYTKWINTTTDSYFILTSFTSAAGSVTANWEEQKVAIDFVVDTGTSPVAPTISGSVTFTGSNGIESVGSTNTVTYTSTNGQIVTKLATDAGTSPVSATTLGQISILGTNGLQTTGSANTVTIGSSIGQLASKFGMPAGTNPVVPDATGLVTLTDGTNIAITGGLNTYSIGLTGLVAVANGGTGVGSQTAYSLVAGGTTSTSPFQAIGPNSSSNAILMAQGTSALPVFTTTGTPYLTALSFNAGTDLLDTYAISTFTPVLEFGGATTGITYAQQVGYYLKIGKLVWFYLVITLSSKGTATGSATIVGFPFTPAYVNQTPVTYFQNLTTTSGPYVSYAVNGLITGSNSAGAIYNYQNTDFANTTTISISGSYISTT